jgi:hypothetical protein
VEGGSYLLYEREGGGKLEILATYREILNIERILGVLNCI